MAIAPAARTAVFTAHFVLVGAMNPCPCGYAGDPRRDCRCTPQQIDRYRSHLSGPLRDRLDLTIEVAALAPEVMADAEKSEPSSAIRERVIAARDRQRVRYGPDGPRANGMLTPTLVSRHCRPDGVGARLLSAAVERLGLSARGYDRVRKVARTIADLDGVEQVAGDHIAEALQFRMST